MIELRTFAGGALEAAEFTQRIWRQSSRHAPFPVWDERYFDWQLMADRPGSSRDLLVAAYDGTRIVGCFFSEKFPFILHGETVTATTGGWMTVDPEYRGDGVARGLAEEQRKRHREHEARFNLGYGLGGSSGYKFWYSVPGTRNLGKIGFWARALDSRAIGEWAPRAPYRWAGRALAPLAARPPQPRSRLAVRPYRTGDLEACLALVSTFQTQCDLSYVWTPERLSHQLSYQGYPKTLVMERNGKVDGFLNYYHIDLEAKSRVTTAMIDLMAFGALSSRDQQDLVLAALEDMARDGVRIALVLRLPCYRAKNLWMTGFLPVPRESSVVCSLCDPPSILDGVRSLHVHWR